MQSLWKLTIFLSCIWAATLLYGEMIAFWRPLWTCSWPQPPQYSAQMVGNSTNHSNLVKAVILADPQLMDRTSLRLAPKSFALETAQFYTDLYMRRSFHSSILPLRPELVVFLGDKFDGGLLLTDEEWQESLSRFKHIFDLNQYRQDVIVHYLSGNHDIGYAGFHSRHAKVINRYEEVFGSRNYRFSVGRVDFIVVDAQTLDGPLEGNLTSTSWDFIKNVSMDVSQNMRILLTHIPLFRPDNTACGPYRASPIINQRISWDRAGQGIMYQNYLSEETSKRLVDSIKPILVLSGHDHDQCTITHKMPFGTVTEHTVGTLSWQQGNLYPSFMLLSMSALKSSNESFTAEEAVLVQLCFLPWQTHIYIWYLFLFVTSILLLLFWPTNGLGAWFHYNYFFGFLERAISGSFGSSSKEKNEDDNCDYEMIWDAEGVMHLVKKAVKNVQITNPSVSGPTGRGGAVVRPAAKKHVNQDSGPSLTVDINADLKLDDEPGKASAQRASHKSCGRLAGLVIATELYLIATMPLQMEEKGIHQGEPLDCQSVQKLSSSQNIREKVDIVLFFL
ncbi:hypothetical protein H6P81_017564 [Aristolochia fimbriata]|uniref:Calcineurin-like phosphoesterase domain-containing protein n=1 Tax=Aristolochia fimbriata TaxID=158543 RepID=A0AAV7DYL9_ARIFI|nr:hypothetical protein H6P81_017564 [Aristolochia fimbriata]